MRVLIVEDEPLIVLDIEEAIVGAGFIVAAVANELDHALQAAKTTACDVAVVDLYLGGENASPVMAALKLRSIPFVSISGCSRENCPPECSGFPFVQKPYEREQLIASLSQLVSAAAA